MFLGELGGRVHIARVRGRVLGDQARRQLRSTAGTVRLEPARFQVSRRPRSRPDRAVARTVVASFAVDHHRTGQDQASHTRLGHRRKQHRCPEIITPDVLGRVREVIAQADHRCLMTHGVDAPQGPVHRLPIADVRDDSLGVAICGGYGRAVYRRQQRVEHDCLMPGRCEGMDDLRPDKSGSTGNQYAHGAHARPPANHMAGSGAARHGIVRDVLRTPADETNANSGTWNSTAPAPNSDSRT